LTPTAQGASPSFNDPFTETSDCHAVSRYGVIVQPASDDRTQPFSLLGYWLGKAFHQFLTNPFHGRT
jgi:hypothetical protein